MPSASITWQSGGGPLHPPVDLAQQSSAQSTSTGEDLSITSAQQKNDKDNDHNDHYRPDTDVHGLVPPLAPAACGLVDLGA